MRYINLFLMAAMSFVAMYVLMYGMVDRYANVYPNVNQLYMAGIMTIAMVAIELWLMGAMYSNKKLNSVILILSLGLFLLLFIFLRRQTAVTDQEFLKSMIPHHAAALLMCEQAPLQDPELKELCATIRTTQQSEIDFMKAKLKSLEK